MRAQINHDKAYSPAEVLLENLMGGNCGNWLYQYSLYRAIMVDENIQIDVFNPMKDNINDEFINHANETYDYCLLPLANAFKTSFAKEFRILTSLVKKLKIPCIVPCVGIQALNTSNFNEKFEDKEASKEFIKAVLDKSAIIGIRGEATADFFEYLGFKSEEHFTVVGCPSMFLHGSKLPEVKPLRNEADSLFLINSKVEFENKSRLILLNNMIKEHPNYIFAPQRLGDMINSYYGIDFRMNYTKVSGKRFYDNAKSVCFTSPYRWIDYVSKNVDLSIGTRLHGNIACVLGGVPSFIVAPDQRVSELAKYHNIAYIPFEQTDKNTNISSLIENVDFNRVHIGHKERFNHFVDMLEKNGINTAYSENRDISHVYFDDVLASLDFSDDVLSFDAIPMIKKIERTRQAAILYATNGNAYREKIKKLKNSNANLKATVSTLQENSLKNKLKKIFR